MSDPGAGAGMPDPEREDLASRTRSLAGELALPEPAPGDVAAEDTHARAALAVLSRAGLIEELVPPQWRETPGGAVVSAQRVCVIREELASILGSRRRDVRHAGARLARHRPRRLR